MIALTGNRDSAAPACNDQLTGVNQGADSADFNNFSRLWRSNHTSVTASCVLLHDISVFFGCNLGLFFGHEVADWLAGSVKCRIFCIHTHLCNHGSNRDIVHFAVVKFLSQGVLKVIADVGLAHCHTDGEGSVWLVCVFAAQRGHGIVDHADLRAIAMGYDDFATFFNEVHDSFRGNLNSYHLLRKCVAKSVAAQCDDNTFFLVFHSEIPLYRRDMRVPRIVICTIQLILEIKRAAGPLSGSPYNVLRMSLGFI